MPKLTIDGKETIIAAGKTLLEAAGILGIEIPTLCNLEGIQHSASCMVCVVQETHSGRFLPACATLAADGMNIITHNEEVRRARRIALQLLLNDHLGNCVAPCQKSCPANLNIPQMIRLVRQEKYDQARLLVKDQLILPGVIGRICPAYCEIGCAATQPDPSHNPVRIKLLHHYLIELGFESKAPYLPEKKAATGRKVAIIGAGPTGLAAAFQLLREGHTCHLFEQRAEPGGALQDEISTERMPKGILKNEIQVIQELGAEFFTNIRVGQAVTLKQLQSEYGALVLAWGQVAPALLEDSKVNYCEKGIKIVSGTFLTSVAGIFAGGNAIRSGKATVRSVADGKAIAASVHQYLARLPEVPNLHHFNSHYRRSWVSAKGLLTTPKREAPAIPEREGFTQTEAAREVAACLQCDCKKAENCKLRKLASDYQPLQRSRLHDTKTIPSPVMYGELAFEPGKCIQCGICVRLTEKSGLRIGLAFRERGYQTTIGIPFDEPCDETFRQIITDLEANCPTGALVIRKEN